MKTGTYSPRLIPTDVPRLIGALKDISDTTELRLGQLIENLSVSREPAIGLWEKDTVAEVLPRLKHICILGYLGVDSLEEAHRKAGVFINDPECYRSVYVER